MGAAGLRALSVSIVALMALGLGGCGGDDDQPGGALTTPRGSVVWIYSSLRGAPFREKDSMNKAIRLALDASGSQAGALRVRWEELNRSVSANGDWTEDQVASDARFAARNPRTVGYIGEFASEATRTAIPILNNAGISMISPASTHVGLTTDDDPGGPKREPQRYYPSQVRTFARVIPRDTVQAAALVAQMRADGCRKVALATDADSYGASLGRLVQVQAKDSGITLVGRSQFTPQTSARTLADGYRDEQANCFLLAAGAVSPGAARLYRTVANALGPRARLYGTSRLCTRNFTSPGTGMPTAVAKRFACVVPTIPATASPSAASFVKAYRRRWRDETPTPYAIYAYEAMKLYLDTIADLGAAGASKETVVAALHPVSERRSVIGSYEIDLNGDISSTAFAVYKIGSRGIPTYSTTVRPTVR